MNVQRYGIAPDYVYGHDKFGPVNQGTEKPYYVLESAFDRVTAERDALQLRLNAVEEENDRLRNQVTRALPFLSDTPDLVQNGAESLAKEIRSDSSWRTCYGPNEWGTECGKCGRCAMEKRP